MIDQAQVTLSPFQPHDQRAAKALILEGLGEHWGFIDSRKNPDLDDIVQRYSSDVFLIARIGETIVGTGALKREADHVGRIVRMSVAREFRRRGIGIALLNALVDRARRIGYRRLVLETTLSWIEVIEFYKTFGFRETHRDGENVHFALNLGPEPV